jgi:hypothetical protein
MESWRIGPPSLTPVVDGGQWPSSHYFRFSSRHVVLNSPTEYEDGWAQEIVWIPWSKEKTFIYQEINLGLQPVAVPTELSLSVSENKNLNKLTDVNRLNLSVEEYPLSLFPFSKLLWIKLITFSLGLLSF